MTARERTRAGCVHRMNRKRWSLGGAVALPVVLLFASPQWIREGEALSLTYVANHGVFLTTGSTSVVLDALYDRPNPAYIAPGEADLRALASGSEPFAPVDLVLVTHNHPDHFAPGVVDRFLAANPRAWLVAPADAIEALRAEGGGWEGYRERVVALELELGETVERRVNGVEVRAVRTLHSGERESPVNLVYLVEMEEWSVAHEGDSNHLPATFRTLMTGKSPVDLAVVHDWWPFNQQARMILSDILKPRLVALGHRPLNSDGPPPGDVDALGEEYFLMDHPGERVDLPRRQGTRIQQP